MNQELNFPDATWVEGFMKMKKSGILTVGFALVVAAVTTVQAQPSEARLMKETKVAKSRAEKTALTKVPDGIIKSAELEREHGLLIWSFDIAKPDTKNITEVQVDAKTGKIASVKIEILKDQATEAAAEKK